jgi:hypothetical protein
LNWSEGFAPKCLFQTNTNSKTQSWPLQVIFELFHSNWLQNLRMLTRYFNVILLSAKQYTVETVCTDRNNIWKI